MPTINSFIFFRDLYSAPSGLFTKVILLNDGLHPSLNIYLAPSGLLFGSPASPERAQYPYYRVQPCNKGLSFG